MEIKIESTAFKNEEMIPSKYTCDGENINPPLNITGIPEGTKSVALILDDPDAPSGVFTHWIFWNLDPGQTEIREKDSIEDGIVGENDAGETGYAGPCPPASSELQRGEPSGTHRYFFKIYALDNFLALPHGAQRDELEKAMEGHIIDEGELIGKYTR